MKIRITGLFGIQHPIIQGAMHVVGVAELAAAVPNAGGLGLITGLIHDIPSVKEPIDRFRLEADAIIRQALASMPGA